MNIHFLNLWQLDAIKCGDKWQEFSLILCHAASAFRTGAGKEITLTISCLILTYYHFKVNKNENISN